MKQNTRETWIQNTQNSSFWSFSVRCNRDAKIHTGENIVSATKPTNLLKRPTHNLWKPSQCATFCGKCMCERGGAWFLYRNRHSMCSHVRGSTETGLLAQWERPTFDCNFVSRLSCQSDSKCSLHTSTCESAAQLQCPASVLHATVTNCLLSFVNTHVHVLRIFTNRSPNATLIFLNTRTSGSRYPRNNFEIGHL